MGREFKQGSMGKRLFSLVVFAVFTLLSAGFVPLSPLSPASASQTASDMAATSLPAPSATSNRPTSAEPALTVTITSVGNPTIREGEKLHVQARIANNSASPVTVNAQLSVHGASFTTRNHVLAFIGESTSADDSSQRLVSVATTPAPIALGAHSENTLSLEATPETLSRLGWNANDWGARGIELSVSSDKITSTDRSFVIVAPASDIARVPTGVAVSLTNSRSELSALYSADSLAEIRVKPTERLENLANSMSMEGVSFFADPHYAFLSHAPQTIKTANANADVLGLLDLQRTDRAQSLTSETFKDGTAPVRVTSLGSARAFEDYRQLGASSFILNSSWCDNAKKHYATPAAHTVLEDSGQSFDVLLSDDESVRVIANAPNSLQARQNALALSAMSYRELPSLIRPQLLYFDLADDEMWKAGSQGEPASGYWQLSTAISALLDAPWVQKAQVADLLNTPASETFTVTEEAKSEHSSLLTSEILTSIDADVAQASIPAHLVEENASVLSPITTASSHLYSQNWQGDSETYNRALENFSRLAHNYGNSVSAVSVSTINLLAEQADIPVHIQNTLPVPATVKVRLDSTDVRLSAKETVTAELPPASTTTVTIPVNAKGSGNVHAKIRLYDSGGTEVGNPVTVKVRVRSGWESTATAVVAIALALMLIIGVVRSVKGGRRSNPVNLSEYTQNRRDADLALADSAEKRDFHRTRKTEPKETPLETRKN